MSFLKEYKFSIILIYINILFIVTLTKVSYKVENFNYLFISVLYFSGILFYWFYTSALRNKKIKFVFVVLLIGMAAFYFYRNSDYVINFFQLKIIDNFNIINNLVAKSMPTNFDNFKPIFIVVLPILTCIVIFFTTKGMLNSVLILNLALTTTLWYLGYTEEIKKYLFYYVLISLITYSINSFTTNTKRLSKKGIKIGIASYKIFIYATILSIIIASVSGILPQEYSGKYSTQIQSKFYNKFINSSEAGEAKGKKFRYDLSFSGYDNNKKKLGGPVVLNKLVAFKVESDKPYYLKGTVKEIYDGFSWSQSEKPYKQKNNNETSLLQDEFSLSYVNSTKTIRIYPVELNSSTIFIPDRAYNAYTEKGYIYYDDIPTFISSEVLTNPYTVNFYDLNDSALPIINYKGNQRIREVSAVYYAEHYKKYLQVPDNLSQRTYDLVYSLTKDKRNNIEKVQAIRDYLNKNYPYTLKVSNVPEGQEFLDYFLFTEKKGYCTYFATAETIMCRIAGIPARYVEGFNMADEKDETGQYVVRNETSHAWTEVLYLANETQGLWYTVDAVPNAVDIVHEDEKREAENNNSIDIPSNETEGNVNRPQQPTGGEAESDAESTGKLIIPPRLLKAIYVLAGLILVHLLMLLIFAIRKRYMFKTKSIIFLYKYSLERLETIGYKGSEFIPDMDLINKMGEDLSFRVKEAAALAYREYYGKKEPENFDKKEYYRFIETYIKNRQSKFEYFIEKYYFLRKISLFKEKIVLLYKKIRTMI
jgi:transglutaminase-like putative cysteine protease